MMRKIMLTSQRQKLALIWMATALLLFQVMYPHYLISNTFFWVSFLTLPISLRGTGSASGNHFLIMACATAVAGMCFPTTLGIYLFMWLTALFLIGSCYQRPSPILMVHAALLSPMLPYISSLISFPIRMALSGFSGKILALWVPAIRVTGNVIHLANQDFLVDQACSGLFMLEYGLLFGTLLIAHMTRRQPIRWKELAILYPALILLLVISNVLRIIVIIAFAIAAENWLHAATGLLLYLVAVLLPFYAILKKITSKNLISQSEKVPEDAYTDQRFSLKIHGLSLLMLLMILRNDRQPETVQKLTPDLPSFSSQPLKDDILKLESREALLYIKPPVAPYRADHNPAVCWQGSGFEFTRVTKIEIADLEITMAQLSGNHQKLYTAWWFESWQHRTGDQWRWRKDALLNGEQFYLINLTCPTEDLLTKNLIQLLTQKSIFKTPSQQS